MSVGEFWPERGIQSNTWTLNHNDTVPAALSGDSVSVSIGEPYWTIAVDVVVPARSSLVALWEGFFARRKGSRNSFTANRSFNSFPAARDVSSDVDIVINSWDRVASTIDYSQGGDVVLPTPGDVIGYYTAAQGYYAGKVLNTLNAGGASALVELDPPPFEPHATLANMRRIKALGEFRLDGPPRPVEKSSRRSWSFTATQVIRG